jgi:hypothetical protein
MAERDIQDAIRAMGVGDLRLFRNQVGTGTTRDGRFIRFGLHPGSPDLIGWRRVTVTPGMVGQIVAVAVGIEVKTTRGRVSPEQQTFLAHMQAFGALAGVARSADEAQSIVDPGNMVI